MFDLGLQSVFIDMADYSYVGAFADLDELKQSFETSTHEFDVLVMDYHQAFTSYPQLLATLRNANPRLRILFVLPRVPEENVLLHALRSGGDGYLPQTVTREALLGAINEIVNGHCYIHTEITPAVLEELRKPVHTMKEWDSKVQLAERERLLIQLAADGLSNVQIGQVLGLAEKTVRNLWSTLFEKIGYKDRTQAVLWAIRTGQAEVR